MNNNEFLNQAAYTIKRGLEYNIKGRKQGLAELADDIDAEGLKCRDIFEFGIRLASDGFDSENINSILSNMIDMEYPVNPGEKKLQEQDETARRLKIIQKEAVLKIQEGLNSWLFLCTVFSFLSNKEQEEIKTFLNDDSFTEFFKMY